MTGISITFWNAGGLSAAKLTEIKTIIKKKSSDVVGIVEAGVSSEKLQQYTIDGYNMYALKRGRQVASGIIVGVKKELTTKFVELHKMEERNKLEAVELSVWREVSKYKIIFVYNPPNNLTSFEVIEKQVENNTIIIGDFNAQSTRWGYKNTTQVGNTLEDFIDSNLIEMLTINEPSFISYKGETSNPDLAIAHVNLLPITSLTLLESPSGYGHRILHVSVAPKRVYASQTQDTFSRWNFKKAKWKEYAALTNERITNKMVSATNPDTSWKNLHDALWECALRTIPRGKKRKYKPFWTDELTELKRQRDETRKKAERSGALRDSVELRHKQAALTKAIIQAKRSCFTHFVENLNFKEDGKKAFSFFNKLANHEVSTSHNEPLIVDGKEISGNYNKACALVRYYKSVGQRNKQRLSPAADVHGCLTYEEDQIFATEFRLEELTTAMTAMKANKCAGPDNIPIELIANLGFQAKEVLLKFINVCWKTGIPAQWRKAEIIPVLKKDKPPSDPSSYRPISLTNATCKLMERMVVNRLDCFLEDRKLLSEYQAGFRKNRGTIEQVAYLTQMIKDGFHRHQSTVAVFIDFKAAYDHVWRKLLLNKLQQKGVKGNMLSWLKSFLAQRFARVCYNGAKSKYHQFRNGLPQGAVSSCTLFNIMINDLIESMHAIPGVNCLSFADDIVIFSTASNIHAICTILNSALEQVYHWCNENNMVVNLQKTVCQLFTLSTKQHDVDLQYNEQRIRTVEITTYLGVNLDKKLNWKSHVNKLTASGESRLRLLKRVSGVTWGASQELLTTTYKTYIRPATEYGADLLTTASQATCNTLNKVHNKALRVITGGAKSTPIAAMEIQADIEPPYIRREASAIKLVEKLKRLPVSYWENYQEATQRLSTQPTILAKAAELRNKFELDWPQREKFPTRKISDLQTCLPKYHLSIGLETSKSETPAYQLRASTNELIATKYPKDEWIHIYTDGSANRLTSRSGAGYCSPGLFEGSVPLSCGSSNFDAEIRAINEAIKKVAALITSSKKMVLFIDSQAAIQALCSRTAPRNELLRCTRREVGEMIKAGWECVYQWIPSHCGVDGNEQVDRLAKSGCEQSPPEEPITYQQAAGLTMKKCQEIANQRSAQAARGKKWEPLLTSRIPSDLPRKDLVANFRLQTGHDYLQAHLFRIGIKNTPHCPLCQLNSEMDFGHLEECPTLKSIIPDDASNCKWKRNSKLYWAARKEMAYKPPTGVG